MKSAQTKNIMAAARDDDGRPNTSKSSISNTCTALIVHPTHKRGILSAICRNLHSQREIVLTGLPVGPKIITLMQGEDTHIDEVGQLVWQSGIALANYLGCLASDSNRYRWTGKRVCELGCGGSPLSSMVLGAWGAGLAVATDGQASVLSLANKNVTQNYYRMCGSKEIDIKPGQVVCECLKWGDVEEIERLKARAGGPFDLVCAADVIYYASGHDALLQTLSMLGGSTTEYYLAFKQRLHAFEGGSFGCSQCPLPCSAPASTFLPSSFFFQVTFFVTSVPNMDLAMKLSVDLMKK